MENNLLNSYMWAYRSTNDQKTIGTVSAWPAQPPPSLDQSEDLIAGVNNTFTKRFNGSFKTIDGIWMFFISDQKISPLSVHQAAAVQYFPSIHREQVVLPAQTSL